MNKFFAGLLIASVSVACFAGVVKAKSYTKAVQKYCQADYKKYCSDYGLETTGLRSCMDRNGKSLSKSCVRALVQSGETSHAYVKRRKN